mgnify:CR=1 FL=1
MSAAVDPTVLAIGSRVPQLDQKRLFPNGDALLTKPAAVLEVSDLQLHAVGLRFQFNRRERIAWRNNEAEHVLEVEHVRSRPK